MPTLSEICQAFAKYRRKSGRKTIGMRYPQPLKTAVCSLLDSDEGIRVETLAESIGVTVWTVRRWLKEYSASKAGASPFVELKVEDPASPLTISHGSLEIRVIGATSSAEVEKLIRLLLAG